MTTVDRKVRQFKDFSFLFTKHPSTADIVKKTDDDSIKQSLRNLLLTKHYERPFHPEIGCQIHSLLFENWDPIVERTMQQTIIDVVNKFEPRVRLLNVRINPQPDSNGVEVSVEFQVVNSDRPVTLTTALNRVR